MELNISVAYEVLYPNFESQLSGIFETSVNDTVISITVKGYGSGGETHLRKK